MATLLELYDLALDEMDHRVALVGDEQWAEPTPCTEWDVRALLAHVVDECRWVPYLLDGGTPAAAGNRFAGDPLGDRPKAAWALAMTGARQAAHREGVLDHRVTVSYGAVSGRDYLWQLTTDLTVHTWDLARAVGADEHLDPELVRRIYSATEKDVDALAASGRFAAPIPVPTHADMQHRMLGMFGRRA